MKISRKFDFTLTLLITVCAMVSGSQSRPAANQEKLCEGFVEENNLRIPISNSNQKLLGGVTEAEFSTSIAMVESTYSSIFKRKGLKLQVKKMWTNDQVNAQAYNQNGYSVVEIWGGLGRHNVMTPDGVTLVTCHEVGHHLGGLPKFTDPSGRWASVEGEADYFATLKCLRKVFAPQADTWNGEVDPLVQEKCVNSFGDNTKESRVCMRIGMAGLTAAKLSAAISNGRSPNLSTSDPNVVTKTYELHPAAQCRLDTYVHGDYCMVSDTVELSDSNMDTGVCRSVAEEEYGARPLCWFKPINLPPPAPPAPAPMPTPQPPPTDGIALTPNLNGAEVYSSHNPNQMITFTWDVSGFAGAAGVYFEVTRPNGEFAVPNGVTPDPRAIPGGAVPIVRGQINILPLRQLPGWGVYKFRVVPLDRTGRRAVGRFSNPAVLNLSP